MPIRRSLCVVALLFGLVLFLPATVRANGGLLWHDSAARSLIAPQTQPIAGLTTTASSLFVGQSGNSLFRPYPVPQATPAVVRAPAQSVTREGRLLDLIASAEAGREGYDAVVWAAKIPPPGRPTDLTIGEIYQWIAATPNQHHAIGRYQFIPQTLRRLVRITGAGPDQRFTPAYQDQLASILLEEAGFHRFKSRELGRVAFMNNLAKIWAGLPNASGRSHYHGIAGNRATMSWARFDAEMATIFPL